MKIIHTKPLYHILYWIFSLITLTLVFGHSWNSGLHAFYFISLLFPVMLGTSYFINYFLVPKYLLTQKKLSFILYLCYALIISLYLEMLVLMFSLSYLANFTLSNLPPNASDILLLSLVMYLVVIIGSFLVMMQQWSHSQKEINELKSQQHENKRTYLEVKSQRKNVKIPFEEILYIESLSDYVLFITQTEQIKSKEAISKLELRLPDEFLRIHRSFIVNLNKVTSITSNDVTIGKLKFNIGRTFKKHVMKHVRTP